MLIQCVTSWTFCIKGCYEQDIVTLINDNPFNHVLVLSLRLIRESCHKIKIKNNV